MCSSAQSEAAMKNLQEEVPVFLQKPENLVDCCTGTHEISFHNSLGLEEFYSFDVILCALVAVIRFKLECQVTPKRFLRLGEHEHHLSLAESDSPHSLYLYLELLDSRLQFHCCLSTVWNLQNTWT